jgi:hypothetical protein
MLELLFLCLLFFSPQEYPLSHGKPTSNGIDLYINDNKYTILNEVQKYLNDTIFLDLEIKTDNLSTYTDYNSTDLAYHFTNRDGTDEIIIDNQEKYITYDIKDLSKFKKINFTSLNAFVKTTLIHELGHAYFLQIILKAKLDSIDVYKEYDFRTIDGLRMFPNPEETFGASFIEEGVCQYIVEGMKQEISTMLFTPKTNEDVIDFKNAYQVKYSYSVRFLKSFLDSLGLKQGIRILVTHKPPTYKEILNPDLYFNRLKL